MKTTIAICCLLGLGVTLIFTKVKNKTQELIETTNRYIIERKSSTLERIEDHKTHNDIVMRDGKMLCVKTGSLYRIK